MEKFLNTGLISRCDNRTGSKLELVFLTLNEERRITKIIDYYSKYFDIVILDGGSTDDTCNITESRGGSVFIRVGENFGENHFACYVNQYTKSGKCFYMMCDEFIDINKLMTVSSKLERGDCNVFGRRFDWFYGVRANKFNCLLPKGFVKGGAYYNSGNFHNTLNFKENANVESYVVDVEHLHVFSVKDEYGKFGYYIYQEVGQICENKKSFIGLTKRFLKLVRALQLNSFRFISEPRIIVFLIAQFFATFFLFIMAVIEIKLLPSKSVQLDLYCGNFDDKISNN